MLIIGCDFHTRYQQIATSAGALCYDADFHPFGGEDVFTNTCPQNYKFEGKERDTETGNDDFGARYHSSVYGRWLSPDWSSVPAPVPYANLTNPQTLNLYAMVSDNPESFADLDGHFWGPGDWFAQLLGEVPGAQAVAAAQGVTANANQDQNASSPSAQDLAKQVPSDVKKAINDSVKASNSPGGLDGSDKKGGFHEEGGMSLTTTDGNRVVAPAVPGPAAKPGENATMDPGLSVHPTSSDKIQSVDIEWHVHPRGYEKTSFVQPPSQKDKDNANAPINIVVGAGNNRVYFYDHSKVIAEMSVKDFMKEPQ
jgi:RHS repeat-associated protein